MKKFQDERTRRNEGIYLLQYERHLVYLMPHTKKPTTRSTSHASQMKTKLKREELLHHQLHSLLEVCWRCFCFTWCCYTFWLLYIIFFVWCLEWMSTIICEGSLYFTHLERWSIGVHIEWPLFECRHTSSHSWQRRLLRFFDELLDLILIDIHQLERHDWQSLCCLHCLLKMTHSCMKTIGSSMKSPKKRKTSPSKEDFEITKQECSEV